MAEKPTPADINDYHCKDYTEYSTQIENELGDQTLTKQEAIVRALERLVNETKVTSGMIRAMCGQRPEERPEWYVQEMSLSEFLYELPAILNSLALNMYGLQMQLNRAVFFRWRRGTAVQPSDADKPHDDGF